MLHCGTMKKGTYYLLIAGVIAAMVFVVGFGIALGNPVIPGILIIAGVGVIYLCRKKVTDVMDDDLSDTIYGKAAVNALLLTIIIAAIVFAVTTAFSLGAGYGGGFHSYRQRIGQGNLHAVRDGAGPCTLRAILPDPKPLRSDG